MTATHEGVVNRRSEMLAEIAKNREEDLDRELKEGGEAAGIGALAREVPEGDPLRPDGIPEDDWAAMSDEQKNNAIAESKREAETGDGETEEERQAREQAEAKKTEKLKIDGQEQDVDVDRIMDAGRRALQKELAADKRLEEASKAREEAERLRAEAAAAATRQPAPEKRSPQEMIVAKEELKAIVQKIQYGSEDEAAEALAEYGTKMAQLGQTERLTEAELLNILDLREAQQFVKTNYADVVGDANLKKLFVSNINEKLAAGDSRSYQEIAKEVGDELRTWKGAPQQQQATQQKPGAVREAVHQRKTATVQIPSAAARQPAPSQPKAPTASEIIERERERRDRMAGRLR